jgi:hypothetical protein
MKAKLTILTSIIFLLGIKTVFSQETRDRGSFDLKADIVSSYLWRGTVADPKPNIQPCLTYTFKNFSIGAFGSTNLDNSYREVDFFASYSFKNFTFTLNDYYWSPFIDSLDFTNYDYVKSGHFLEGVIDYEISESFPLKIQAATIFFGPDNKFDHFDSVTGETFYVNYYSTYFEASYPFALNGYDLKAFVGGTPSEGMFGTKAGIVNMGLTAFKTIKASASWDIPVTGSLIFNPQQSKIYFTLGITL